MSRIMINNNNSVALVRERIILTERPPLVAEVSSNFCGWRGVILIYHHHKPTDLMDCRFANIHLLISLVRFRNTVSYDAAEYSTRLFTQNSQTN
jgi:hypothetical protein